MVVHFVQTGYLLYHATQKGKKTCSYRKCILSLIKLHERQTKHRLAATHCENIAATYFGIFGSEFPAQGMTALIGLLAVAMEKIRK